MNNGQQVLINKLHLHYILNYKIMKTFTQEELKLQATTFVEKCLSKGLTPLKFKDDTLEELIEKFSSILESKNSGASISFYDGDEFYVGNVYSINFYKEENLVSKIKGLFFEKKATMFRGQDEFIYSDVDNLI